MLRTFAALLLLLVLQLEDIDPIQGATASVVRSDAGVYEMARWVERRNR